MRSGRPSILYVFFALALVSAARIALSAADSEGKAAKPIAATPSYQGDIKSLLDAKCVRCHNAKTHKSDLDLSTPSAILKGGESGPGLVPGKPDESTLYKKIHAGAMPPGKKDPLSETEVDSVRRWITGGAKWNTDDNQQALEAAVSQHDVYPILLRRCTACHGLLRKEGNLDLRTKASLLRGGKSGPGMVPGKPEESLIVKRVRSAQMPPRDRLVEASVKLIEPGEVEVLVRWIAAGAPESAIEPDVATTTADPLVSDKDRDFWAFRAPRPVSIPAVKH
jgi:mono/diheme cytochrome c family protein